MRTTKIGLLVAIALAILMVTVFSLNQEQPFWERKVQYEVRFTRTGGLQTGAPVSLSGVSIGTVAEMRFPPDPAVNYIQVLINVKGDLAPRIRENTVASIRTLGLLGDRYIELSAGMPESPPVPPGGLIASIDPTDIEALLGQGGDIVTNIAEVTASLKDVLGAIQRGEGLLGAMLRNRELGETTLVDLQRTMANVQATTASLEKILQRVDRGEGMLGQLTIEPRQRGARTADGGRDLRPARARQPRPRDQRPGGRGREARPRPGHARQAGERSGALPRRQGARRWRAQELVPALLRRGRPPAARHSAAHRSARRVSGGSPSR